MKLKDRIRLAYHVFRNRPLAYKIQIVNGAIYVEENNTKLVNVVVDSSMISYLKQQIEEISYYEWVSAKDLKSGDTEEALISTIFAIQEKAAHALDYFNTNYLNSNIVIKA